MQKDVISCIIFSNSIFVTYRLYRVTHGISGLFIPIFYVEIPNFGINTIINKLSHGPTVGQSILLQKIKNNDMIIFANQITLLNTTIIIMLKYVNIHKNVHIRCQKILCLQKPFKYTKKEPFQKCIRKIIIKNLIGQNCTSIYILIILI